jgi:hypothetical protein
VGKSALEVVAGPARAAAEEEGDARREEAQAAAVAMARVVGWGRR